MLVSRFFDAGNLMLMMGFVTVRFGMIVVGVVILTFIGATRFLFDDVGRSYT